MELFEYFLQFSRGGDADQDRVRAAYREVVALRRATAQPRALIASGRPTVLFAAA